MKPWCTLLPRTLTISAAFHGLHHSLNSSFETGMTGQGSKGLLPSEGPPSSMYHRSSGLGVSSSISLVRNEGSSVLIPGVDSKEAL
ncbi:uncharacterized protein DS421_7g210710 [Arachis hypogaea]|nr:uncharacterized protein DS421_7g210710 [Arachis hypogaea]